MPFRDDVPQVPGLEDAYCAGLKALRKADRQRIDAAYAPSLHGSVDIDSSLRSSTPNEARWDYVVASANRNNRNERLYWIEVHPATSKQNFDEVRAKYAWLRTWLGSDARRLDGYPKEYVWITSGKCAYHAGTPIMKKLASEGIRFAGRHLRISD